VADPATSKGGGVAGAYIHEKMWGTDRGPIEFSPICSYLFRPLSALRKMSLNSCS